MFNREHSEHTESSPNYGISLNMLKTVTIGTLLLLLNMLIMVGLANTAAADVFETLFDIPIIGVIVFGLFISMGRHFSLKGLSNGSKFLSSTGIILLLISYGVFGAGVLSRYSERIWNSALSGTFVVVLLITAIATVYVTNTDRNLSNLAKYSGFAFMIGIILVVVGMFFEVVSILAFPFFIIGFAIDLVYELWLTTTRERSPEANGVAVYVAMAGLFVHLIQIALEALSE